MKGLRGGGGMGEGALKVRVFGAPSAEVGGQPLPPLRKKALALLCLLAVQGRPMARATLARMFWGEGRLVNLRQEIAVLRRLPGASSWLSVTEERVAVVAQTDWGEATALHRRGARADAAARLSGAPLEGLEGAGTDAFAAWLDAFTAEVDALRAAVEEVAPPALAEELLADLLALAAPRPLHPSVVAHTLALPPWQIAAAWRGLTARGWVTAEGRWVGPARATPAGLRQRLGAALVEVSGPERWAAQLLQDAGDHAGAQAVWLALARAGDRAAAACAAEGPASGEALRVAAELAGRAGDAEALARYLQQLQALATATASPRWRLEVALLTCRSAVVAGAWEGARAAVEEARVLVQLHVGWGEPAVSAADRARVSLWEGQIALLRGEDAAARVSLEAAAEGEDAWARAAALASLGALAGRRGEPAVAEALHQAALVAVRALGDRDAAARMFNNLGATAERGGRLEDARRCFVESLALAEHLQDVDLQATAGLNLAEIERRLGRLGVARRGVAAALAGRLPLPRRALALQIRGDIEASCGRWQEAEEWFRRASVAWGEAGSPIQARFAGWLAALAAGVPLTPAGWEALASALPQLREDLVALGWEELARHAPDATRAEEALAARGAAPPLLVALVRARHGGPLEALAGAVTAGAPSASVDHAAALALLHQREGEGWRAALESVWRIQQDGLLSSQAASLRVLLGLQEAG